MSSNPAPLDWLERLIIQRRTQKPANFSGAPQPGEIRKMVEIARHAPNHHRTEPARFYLLNEERIQLVGRMFGEIVSGEGTSPALVERAKRKALEWGNSPGLLVVTCHSDVQTELYRKKPETIQEDYATVACICQNLLLLMESKGIASKWSTGPVWTHEEFASAIGMLEPNVEKVVGLIFYGYCKDRADVRTLSPLDHHMVDHSRKS